MRHSDNVAVREHEQEHTGEAPFQCPHCVYTACREDSLNRHLRIHTVNHHIAVQSNGTGSMASIAQPVLEETQQPSPVGSASGKQPVQPVQRVVHRTSTLRSRTNAHQRQSKRDVGKKKDRRLVPMTAVATAKAQHDDECTCPNCVAAPRP
eukprot:m.258571 g.258571  ORF g.258571 m.258571 type:complete len:151 (-) comp26624_c0_seq2:921-1373(-)